MTELRAIAGIYVEDDANYHCVFEVVLWINITGTGWRELLRRFSKWNAIFKRFNRWNYRGSWQKLTDALADFIRLENLSIDIGSTVVRTYPRAVGAKGGHHEGD